MFSEKILHGDVYQYNALSDGIKKIYTSNDELKEYGNRGILNPDSVSYFNLFINGVLQSKSNYELQKDILVLKTEDIPITGSTIIIFFVTFKDEEFTELNFAEAAGTIPSGHISIEPVTDVGVTIKDPIPSHLELEKVIKTMPDFVVTGYITCWEFLLTVNNTGSIPISNIVVTDQILLDSIINIENVYSSHGNILINEGVINWNIGMIDAGESATAMLKVEGYFRASGLRCISSGFAAGNSLLGPMKTDIICTSPINVGKGLNLNKTTTSGSLKVNVKKDDTWRIEINLFNLSDNDIFDIFVEDLLLIDDINCVKFISISHGTAVLEDNKILWKIDMLEKSENSILVADITGSFSTDGLRGLDVASGIGHVNTGKLFTNTSRDFQIIVLPATELVKKELLVQNCILNNFLNTPLNQVKQWCFSLKISNLSNEVFKNIIVTDYILFDKLHCVSTKSVSSGQVSFSDNLIIWNIEELLPCSSLTATFKVEGSFHTTGLRSLSRAIGTALTQNPDSCIISNISSGSSIKVCGCKHKKKRICVVGKAFPQYKQKYCVKDICVDMEDYDFKSIAFKPGVIMENTLKITDLEDKSNYKKVNFFLKLPFEITTEHNTIIEGCLSNIEQNIIMLFPESETDLSSYVVVETSSKLLEYSIEPDGQMMFSSKTYIIIKSAEHAKELIIEKKHLENPAKVLRDNQCADIFGNLTIKKQIISGPLEVSNNSPNTWNIQIKITNNGYGPVGNIVMTDHLLLNDLVDFQIISLTKGNVSRENNQIIWNIGTLNSFNTAVMTAVVTGVFYSKGNRILDAENHQYNTMSDGVKKEFTNDDELLVYGGHGIPDPNNVSFFSLFINGVLQPEPVYTVEPGLLILKTSNAPQEGVPITLEYLIIKDNDGKLLKAESYQYNALADGGKTYTNSDELTMYGDKGILDPKQTSYQNLFVNGVKQPEINYIVKEGLLILRIEHAPAKEVPITIQFISLFA